MTQQPISFGYALAAQRRAELETAARRNAMVREAKRARREARRADGAGSAEGRIPRQRSAAQCAADIG
ncbi:MAG TPA: hypothetical protein VL551_12785 [Actinospica sp.]|jgi:hypothetical protein|nr:hypothetical protein [Actinospica sp.]